jgi:hypothetical protein
LLARFCPTATHDVAVAHDTPERLLVPVAALGLEIRDQLFPFHCSISVKFDILSSKPTVVVEPTLKHECLLPQAIEERALDVTYNGFVGFLGFVWTSAVHALPFQCVISASFSRF